MRGSNTRALEHSQRSHSDLLSAPLTASCSTSTCSSVRLSTRTMSGTAGLLASASQSSCLECLPELEMMIKGAKRLSLTHWVLLPQWRYAHSKAARDDMPAMITITSSHTHGSIELDELLPLSDTASSFKESGYTPPASHTVPAMANWLSISAFFSFNLDCRVRASSTRMTASVTLSCCWASSRVMEAPDRLNSSVWKEKVSTDDATQPVVPSWPKVRLLSVSKLTFTSRSRYTLKLDNANDSLKLDNMSAMDLATTESKVDTSLKVVDPRGNVGESE
mmetsp:Transcript_29807/g.40947  ORF Transcript_29807/g.40947 Transcript_29807/m.40947 type:complete len:278 (+) Transcript_29807:1909-2742(+)